MTHFAFSTALGIDHAERDYPYFMTAFRKGLKEENLCIPTYPPHMWLHFYNFHCRIYLYTSPNAETASAYASHMNSLVADTLFGLQLLTGALPEGGYAVWADVSLDVPYASVWMA